MSKFPDTKSNTKTKSKSLHPIIAEFGKSQLELKKFGGLPTPEQAGDIWDEIWMVEAHNSTGLEGNTLSLRAVKKFLELHKTSGNKKIQEYLEVYGYANAAKWVYSEARKPNYDNPSAETITKAELRYIHEILVKDVWLLDPPIDLLDSEGPGSFRQHNIKQFDEGMQPPDFVLIDSLISTWLKETNDICADYLSGKITAVDLPAKLAYIHVEFEKIHPFRDGNGRSGRLVVNLILVRLGFAPCIILKTRRIKYLKALQLADNGKCFKLSLVIAQGVLDNVNRFIIPAVMQDDSLVTLESLVTKEFSYAALRQAALRGKLFTKTGENGKYYSTQKAVRAYKTAKFKR